MRSLPLVLIAAGCTQDIITHEIQQQLEESVASNIDSSYCNQ